MSCARGGLGLGSSSKVFCGKMHCQILVHHASCSALCCDLCCGFGCEPFVQEPNLAGWGLDISSKSLKELAAGL